MTGRTRAISCALAALVVVVAFASDAVAQMPKGMAGTWKLNLDKSRFSPAPGPKSMTIVYTPAGDTMKIAVEVVPPTGDAQKWDMTAAYDGKDHPVTGNPMADTISMKRVNDTTGESTFKKGGKVTAVNTRVLSPDGKTLTITTKGTTADGKPRNDVAVYDKQP